MATLPTCSSCLRCSEYSVLRLRAKARAWLASCASLTEILTAMRKASFRSVETVWRASIAASVCALTLSARELRCDRTITKRLRGPVGGPVLLGTAASDMVLSLPATSGRLGGMAGGVEVKVIIVAARASGRGALPGEPGEPGDTERFSAEA
ncbi:hypothetical protein EJ06DRAFT_270377 [Trichodelitschia bisporula]|uniref:Uncharacterized protein n=1 Tax=Trichodelitschia bisporula TaxID=703511 RepID=A0A6G1HIF7_9PEZI|nr:hypothetical protein EJ06DRAFT_270377 [Trichodelitschia bisporula]